MANNNNHSNTFFVLGFTDTTQSLDNSNTRIIAITRDEHTMINLQHRINHLLYSEDLRKLFHRFGIIRWHFNRLNTENIFNNINDIYYTVNKDKMKLKGKCPYCPPHSLLDAF